MEGAAEEERPGRIETKSIRRREEMEAAVLDKVGEVLAAVETAKNAGEVVCALHSVAVILFPVDTTLVAGSIDERFRDQVLRAWVPDDAERNKWRQAFYYGAAFPAIARVLLHNTASKWLSCLPSSARKQVYDSFFVQGPPNEVVEALVSGLQRNFINKDLNLNTVLSNIERLLVLCLLENDGVRHIVKDFRQECGSNEPSYGLLKPDKLARITRATQLLASIPDKTRQEAPAALSSHLYFQRVIIQLLLEVEEIVDDIPKEVDVLTRNVEDGSFLFVGEIFSKICRRGAADILLSEIIPRVLNHVQRCLSLNANSVAHAIESNPKLQFWMRMAEFIKDHFALERLCEELLRSLAAKNVSDTEAYWILWTLFHRAFKQHSAIRSMFVDKFLFWKVFPLCCLRWILQFSVLECPPNDGTDMALQKKPVCLMEVVQRLAVVWSKHDFVQATTMEQQAFITAALGWCIERMSKEDMETTKDVLNSILQGVSCRLESPIHLIRRMASSIALAFSKVVDPKNPLYLDDDCSDVIDWEFGLISRRKEVVATSPANQLHKHSSTDEGAGAEENVMSRSVEASFDEEEDDDNSSDSSLQPYDLSDDDTDLQKKFSQLGELSAALRKSDDPDGVERALDAAERLVRASPDELRHNSKDLVSALLQVRCSDVAVSGEEDSAEEKRQKALVALLVTSPFESLDVLTKVLYSPNVDVGQRILILDVMTDAAQELAHTKTITSNQQRQLISTINNPWYIPNSMGPSGASPWKEVSDAGSSLSWSHRYERDLPSKPGQVKMGKPRRWSLKKEKTSQVEFLKNNFPLYAAAFMLPVMQGFDKKRHGVDLLNRDFIVLGKLIYMLGVCMKCMAMHPEASALASTLLDLLRSREVSNHPEAYVRRSVLFAASCTVMALHPSYVACALIEGNREITEGLEWIRTWALRVAESDPDTECSTMAMACLHSHAEMALQTSRVLESASSSKGKMDTLPSKMDDIILPFSNIKY